MNRCYEKNFRLTGMDADGQGMCKPSALLDHLQVTATLAAETGGFGREVLLERYGAFWMLARSWFRLERPLRWEEEITIRTWHRGGRSALMYRDYDIFSGGERVGESVSGWVLADAGSRKLMRLSSIRELAGTDGGELCKSVTLSKLRCPPDLRQIETRRMRYSDSDINGHVNNTRYADFVCDALELDRRPEGRFVASMQIGYLAECLPGETLTLQTGTQADGHYVRGLDKAGKSRFEAEVFFGQSLP